jgi:hypothetical protein
VTGVDDLDLEFERSGEVGDPAGDAAHLDDDAIGRDLDEDIMQCCWRRRYGAVWYSASPVCSW